MATAKRIWRQVDDIFTELIFVTVTGHSCYKGRAIKAQAPRSGNKIGAQPNHTGHKRPITELKASDVVVFFTPETQCKRCVCTVESYDKPSYRHQEFELPRQYFDITDYQIYHEKCTGCGSVSKGKLPITASTSQIGPNLLSYISVLTGQYHLSIRKV